MQRGSSPGHKERTDENAFKPDRKKKQHHASYRFGPPLEMIQKPGKLIWFSYEQLIR